MPRSKAAEIGVPRRWLQWEWKDRRLVQIGWLWLRSHELINSLSEGQRYEFWWATTDSLSSINFHLPSGRFPSPFSWRNGFSLSRPEITEWRTGQGLLTLLRVNRCLYSGHDNEGKLMIPWVVQTRIGFHFPPTVWATQRETIFWYNWFLFSRCRCALFFSAWRGSLPQDIFFRKGIKICSYHHLRLFSYGRISVFWRCRSNLSCQRFWIWKYSHKVAQTRKLLLQNCVSTPCKSAYADKAGGYGSRFSLTHRWSQLYWARKSWRGCWDHT